MFEHYYDREVFKLCIDVADDILNFIDQTLQKTISQRRARLRVVWFVANP
jgi:hypothetical protein